MRKPRLLFYCQHAIGMGHLTRAFALSRSLCEAFHVVFLSGGHFPPGMAVPSGVELVQLPPLGMDEDKQLVSLDARYSLSQAKAARRALIERTFRSCDPQVVLIELFPFGRKKFADEIVPLLELAHAPGGHARPLVLCSLRDILVGARADQQRHDDRAAMTANRFFDAVLVHADAQFARLEESFRPIVPMTVPVHYTGFVHPGPTPASRRTTTVLVSAGSGSVGAALFRAALAAHRILRRSHPISMRVIAGPFVDDDTFATLRQAAIDEPCFTLERTVPSLTAEMAGAALSVSQCGYNTALDIVAARVPAIVVPYAAEREDEQSRRAQRLEQLGIATWLPQARLSGKSLARAVVAALSARVPASPLSSTNAHSPLIEHVTPLLDLNGAARSTRIVQSLLAAHRNSTLANPTPVALSEPLA